MMKMKERSKKSAFVVVSKVVLFLGVSLLIPPTTTSAFVVVTHQPYNTLLGRNNVINNDIATTTTSLNGWCRGSKQDCSNRHFRIKSNHHRRRKLRNRSLTASSNKSPPNNIVVQYRDRRLSLDFELEDVFDKILEKVDKHQSKWDKKRQLKRRNNRAKKFMMAFLGMGALSCLFPITFFVGGIIGGLIFGIVPMVTVFTLTGIMSVVLPTIVGPFMLYYVISSVVDFHRKKKEPNDHLGDTEEYDEQQRREKEVTAAINDCVTEWNEFLELREEQRSKEQKLSLEASNLYYQAKELVMKSSKVDSSDDKTKKEEWENLARRVLSKRQNVLERKDEATKLGVDYQNQVKRLETNIRKLSDQLKEMQQKSENNNYNKSNSRSPWDNDADPLLRKFREEGIDV